MDVSCQFALYPLGVEHLGATIRAALAVFPARGLEVTPGPMSTLVRGPAEEVFAGLADAFRVAADGGVVLVCTISNACPTH